MQSGGREPGDAIWDLIPGPTSPPPSAAPAASASLTDERTCSCLLCWPLGAHVLSVPLPLANISHLIHLVTGGKPQFPPGVPLWESCPEEASFPLAAFSYHPLKGCSWPKEKPPPACLGPTGHGSSPTSLPTSAPLSSRSSRRGPSVHGPSFSLPHTFPL